MSATLTFALPPMAVFINYRACIKGATLNLAGPVQVC